MTCWLRPAQHPALLLLLLLLAVAWVPRAARCVQRARFVQRARCMRSRAAEPSRSRTACSWSARCVVCMRKCMCLPATRVPQPRATCHVLRSPNP
jgi:hypothetical protein